MLRSEKSFIFRAFESKFTSTVWWLVLCKHELCLCLCVFPQDFRSWGENSEPQENINHMKTISSLNSSLGVLFKPKNETKCDNRGKCVWNTVWCLCLCAFEKERESEFLLEYKPFKMIYTVNTHKLYITEFGIYSVHPWEFWQ